MGLSVAKTVGEQRTEKVKDETGKSWELDKTINNYYRSSMETNNVSSALGAIDGIKYEAIEKGWLAL